MLLVNVNINYALIKTRFKNTFGCCFFYSYQLAVSGLIHLVIPPISKYSYCNPKRMRYGEEPIKILCAAIDSGV
jgi:chemotaxis receptor (MCP) glutamine deamidase CheD